MPINSTHISLHSVEMCKCSFVHSTRTLLTIFVLFVWNLKYLVALSWNFDPLLCEMPCWAMSNCPKVFCPQARKPLEYILWYGLTFFFINMIPACNLNSLKLPLKFIYYNLHSKCTAIPSNYFIWSTLQFFFSPSECSFSPCINLICLIWSRAYWFRLKSIKIPFTHNFRIERKKTFFGMMLTLFVQ